MQFSGRVRSTYVLLIRLWIRKRGGEFYRQSFAVSFHVNVFHVNVFVAISEHLVAATLLHKLAQSQSDLASAGTSYIFPTVVVSLVPLLHDLLQGSTLGFRSIRGFLAFSHFDNSMCNSLSQFRSSRHPPNPECHLVAFTGLDLCRE